MLIVDLLFWQLSLERKF